MKLIQIAENKYKIIDHKGNLIMELEGNFTEEQLQEQLRNYHESYIINKS
ncbi:hypothetical protein [Clostridium fallax]|uniref:Uncharacterized protein n=1 Tax=Clostridium fallax TaxID=1533 RepID=A0A1M4V1R8_9CLOT|nr:hypothetical protein [Clostridium fallax]SHE62813.1 hypothetical protein SAMN05443638_10699 [Clostridium fallax]SQB06594.1 Uncharacterised protein [Clostridium fallax]